MFNNYRNALLIMIEKEQNMSKQTRRDFIENCSKGAGVLLLSTACADTFSAEKQGEPDKQPEVGKPLASWQEGWLDLHFIYTGVGENMFYIYPDGTTMVLDASDRPSNQEDQFPIKPDKSRLPSEWIIRYIKRVSPNKEKIDYMMLSHYHTDHSGSHLLSAGKTTGRGEDYYLSGLANLGEYFKFTKVYDRGYPQYKGPINLNESDGYENFRKFTDWKVKNGEFVLEEFKVGKLDQIALVNDPEKYPGFHIRNIARNGVVWTGEGEKTIDFYGLYPKNYPSENARSLALTIEYGPFRYYTGGDISGLIRNENKEDVHYEGAVGKAAGEVDVCKANHHSYRDAMRSEFTQEVRAGFYLINVWDNGHLQDNTMTNMTDSKSGDAEPIVCHTWVSKKQMDLYKDKQWQKYLKPAYGHIVVRVYDSGKSYKIFQLTAEDESMTVKKVFGPFRSKKS